MAHCDQTLVVTAWVPLVDATIENGCLYVLPWRFDQGILPHKTGKARCVACVHARLSEADEFCIV